MPAKIRLSRHGKKGQAYYHIVVADSRAARDGKFIEKIGVYNPNTNPATIELDTDKAYSWLQKGAQPTDTMRAILSYKGIIYKNHLDKGVKKGALTQEQADEKFNAWLANKTEKINEKKNSLKSSSDKDLAKRFEDEVKVNEAKSNEVAKKRAAAEAKTVAVEDVVENTEEAPEGNPAAEASTEENPA
ncbi:MAG: 30S ribosomal protein S16 [Bacteroidota bacterium]